GGDAAEERVVEGAAAERVVEGGVVGGGDDQRDGGGPAGDQRPRGAVGDVAGFGDGPLHRLAQLRVDVADAVDDAGDGGPRDAGDLGDVFERRRFARRGRPAAGGGRLAAHGGLCSTESAYPNGGVVGHLDGPLHPRSGSAVDAELVERVP